MRLDKFLAACGLGTRTEVKKLIKSGKVSVLGKTLLRPETSVEPQTDAVFVNGRQVQYRRFVYLLLNKPQGYVSATWDKKLPTVIDLIPLEYRHFEPFPVGRLDIDTEGLLLITNDGELAHRLLSPKHHVPKTYEAKLQKPVRDEDVMAFEKGMDLGDFVTLPASLRILSKELPCEAEVTICEGKFHQVKRMFECCDNKVLYLRRTKMKNLSLDDDLKLGEIRELTDEEITQLKESLQ